MNQSNRLIKYRFSAHTSATLVLLYMITNPLPVARRINVPVQLCFEKEQLIACYLATDLFSGSPLILIEKHRRGHMCRALKHA
jgi:hypothetical protein